jgi:DNA-binding HxlR family transcriptional regulator
MEKKDEEKLLKLIGSTGTKQILELLSEQGAGQYKEMKGFTSTHALNRRLRELLSFSLIEHHFEREEGRREWYEITERGKELLKCIETIIEVVEK